MNPQGPRPGDEDGRSPDGAGWTFPAAGQPPVSGIAPSAGWDATAEVPPQPPWSTPANPSSWAYPATSESPPAPPWTARSSSGTSEAGPAAPYGSGQFGAPYDPGANYVPGLPYNQRPGPHGQNPAPTYGPAPASGYGQAPGAWNQPPGYGYAPPPPPPNKRRRALLISAATGVVVVVVVGAVLAATLGGGGSKKPAAAHQARPANTLPITQTLPPASGSGSGTNTPNSALISWATTAEPVVANMDDDISNIGGDASEVADGNFASMTTDSESLQSDLTSAQSLPAPPDPTASAQWTKVLSELAAANTQLLTASRDQSEGGVDTALAAFAPAVVDLAALNQTIENAT